MAVGTFFIVNIIIQRVLLVATLYLAVIIGIKLKMLLLLKSNSKSNITHLLVDAIAAGLTKHDVVDERIAARDAASASPDVRLALKVRAVWVQPRH